MRFLSRHRVITTVVTVVISLLFVQLPNTSAPAVTSPTAYCGGPAAYPPDIATCVDPVVEAQIIAQQRADAAASAAASAAAVALQKADEEAAAAALKAQQDKELQDAIALAVSQAKNRDDFIKAAKAAEDLAKAAKAAEDLAITNANNAKIKEENAQTAINNARKEAKDAADRLAEQAAAAAERIRKAAKDVADKTAEVLRLNEIAAEEMRAYRAKEKALADDLKAKNDALEAANTAVSTANGEITRINEILAEIDSATPISGGSLTTAIGEAPLLLLNSDSPDFEYSDFVNGGAALRVNSLSNIPIEDEIIGGLYGAKGLTPDEISKLRTDLATARSNLVKANEDKVKADAAQVAAAKAAKDALDKAENAAKDAAKAFNEKKDLDKEAVAAAQAQAKLDSDKKAADAALKVAEAQFATAQAEKVAADAAKSSASLRLGALNDTVMALNKVATSSGDAVAAAKEAIDALKNANNQSDAASAAANKLKDDTKKADDDAKKALKEQLDASALADKTREELEKARKDRENAAKAGNSNPVSDQQFALLVAAAARAAEAEKKAKEDKAKADAELAALELEASNQTIDAARKNADAAIEEANRLAAKAAIDIQAINEEAANAINAAKDKAQKIIDQLRVKLNEVTRIFAKTIDSYRASASAARAKADAATRTMNDAEAAATRASEIAASVATDLQTKTNEVTKIQSAIKKISTEDKAVQNKLISTQKSLNELVAEYEKSRIESANYAKIYLASQRRYAEAVQTASDKKVAAQLSKKFADDAVAAYNAAAGLKNLVSTEKPYTSNNAEIGANVLASASKAEISKLKLAADQAVARYNRDQQEAEIAAKAADAALNEMKKVKTALQNKLAAEQALQNKINSFADDLAKFRQARSDFTEQKNSLEEKLRVTRTQVTEKLNELTLAQVDAQKAKVAADNAALKASQYRKDAANAESVVTANEAAIEAAKKAAISVTESSNSIDKLVAPKLVDDSISSLPIIFGVSALVVAATFFTVNAIRKMRRRTRAPDGLFSEIDPEIQRDFDRITDEVKKSVVKRKVGTK